MPRDAHSTLSEATEHFPPGTFMLSVFFVVTKSVATCAFIEIGGALVGIAIDRALSSDQKRLPIQSHVPAERVTDRAIARGKFLGFGP